MNCTNGLSSSCTACNPIYLRILSASPAGSCICQPGFYDNATLLCVACNFKCLTCNSSTVCLTCDQTTNYRIINGSQCSCMPGFYDTGAAICSICTFPCATCSSTSTLCNSCYSDRYLSSNNCLCNNGTFLNFTNQC
jgi:proprotein convertase subtilisin/kexin type 5